MNTSPSLSSTTNDTDVINFQATKLKSPIQMSNYKNPPKNYEKPSKNYITHIYTRGIKNTNFPSIYPYNTIYNNLLNNTDISLKQILEDYKIYRDCITKSSQFTIKKKDEQTIQNLLDHAQQFDTEKKDFQEILKTQVIKDEIIDKFETKQNFELLLTKLKKEKEGFGYNIKSKYLYVGVEWKKKRKNLFFTKYKVTFTFSNQIKGTAFVG